MAEIINAASIFLSFGPTLKGESKSEKRESWIDILSWSFKVTQMGRPYAGKGYAKSEFENISIAKYVDCSTPNLMHACAIGKIFTEVNIEQCKSVIIMGQGRTYGDDGTKARLRPYLTVKLGNVYIASYNLEADGEVYPRERIELNFEAIRYTYVERGDDGTLASKGIEQNFNVQRRDDDAETDAK